MLEGGLAWHGRARGVSFDEIDTLQGGEEQDMLSPGPAGDVVDRCEEGVYGYSHWGIPCRTFTVLLALQKRVLRLRTAPQGRGGLMGRDKTDVAEANQLIRFAVRGMRGVVATGGEVTFENVTDVGDPSIPQCYWPERASMCPLSLHPDIVAFMEWASVTQIHVPLGSFHDGVGPLPPVKWVTLFATPGAAALLAPIAGRRMARGEADRESAIGRNALGQSRAALTAAYPSAFNEWLSLVGEVYAGSGRRDGASAPPGAQIGCGAALHPVMQAAVADARSRRPNFADFRRREAVPRGDRWLLAYPQPHDVTPEFSGERPDASWSIVEEGPDDERPESFAPGFLRPLRAHHGISGLPPGRLAYETIFRRVAESGGARVGYGIITEWSRLAELAILAMERGVAYTDPGTKEVPADLKEEIFRHVLLDTRHVHDVVRMRRSTKDTVFAGDRQMSRAAFRELVEETGWRRVDPDIADQAGEGGIESRSHCPRHTLLGWHHRGVHDMFETAHATSVTEYEDKWLIGSFALPPTEPCRVIPSNVAITHKPTVDDLGLLTTKLKARVTTNCTFGDDDSPNAGVLKGDRTTALPSHQTHAESSAITDSVFRRAGERGLQYCTDMTGAFSFLVEQRDEWWLTVRYWTVRREGKTRKTGFFLQPRMLFGGTWGPNRFTRVQRCKRSRVRARQAEFDAGTPYPRGVQEAMLERSRLQRSGALPAGAEQLMAASLQDFIDDESGSSGSDSVAMPKELAHIDVADIAARTEASGARPAPVDSRAMVHCCISIDETERVGFEHSIEKVQCGDAIVVLGLRADLAADVSDCPPAKALVIIAELAHMAALIKRGESLEREMIERNTGRLSNLSQIEPQLVLYLHSGYALSASTTSRGGGLARRKLRMVPVKLHGVVGSEFMALLTAATEFLVKNEGVPLVHVAAFPALDTEGMLTIVTDASGEDGVGGYAFSADEPKRVYVVASVWPEDIQAALSYAAMRIKAKAAVPLAASFSMPAGETFGQWAVAESVRLAGVRVAAVTALGDCKPASIAITSAKSKSPVMRDIVAASRRTCEQWLGVQVWRKWNSDGDLLSHPGEVHRVVQAARDAGLDVIVLPIHPDCFCELRESIAANLVRRQQAAPRL